MSTLNHDTELEEILNTLTNEIEWSVQVPGAVPIDRAKENKALLEAKAALNTYLYKQTLELIGEDESQTVPAGEKAVVSCLAYRNGLRKELRQAAAERWGQE